MNNYSSYSSEEKLLRANHTSYETKTLQKAIMKRSKSQTKYFKTWNPELLKNFRKQKNYYSRSYRKERKTFFNSLKVSNITGNKMF